MRSAVVAVSAALLLALAGCDDDAGTSARVGVNPAVSATRAPDPTPSPVRSSEATAGPTTSAASTAGTTRRPEAAPAYRTYTNPRFGFSVEIPASFLSGEQPANGDGLGFSDPDGSGSVSMYGENNALAATVESEVEQWVESVESHGGSITLRAIRGNIGTVSGYTGDGDVFYVRYWVGEGSINVLSWTYAKADLKKYRAAVEHSADLFRPGDLTEGH